MTIEDYNEVKRLRWWHRMHLGTYEGKNVISQGECDNLYLTNFIPAKDIVDKQVADIGCWDGLFSFYCEKLGAKSVVAMDCPQDSGGNWSERGDREYTPRTFALAKRLMGSKVAYANFDLQATLSNLTQFDTILCFGVIYHLTNPIKGIHNLCKMLRPGGTILLETAINDFDRSDAIWQLKRGHDNDDTNYFYPNEAALAGTFGMFGKFKIRELWNNGGTRAMFEVTNE
jgi:2-polyprenyl-3-methyl-5-hydroxy-6-metoxy-1,4-benzoquinol methylase